MNQDSAPPVSGVVANAPLPKKQSIRLSTPEERGLKQGLTSLDFGPKTDLVTVMRAEKGRRYSQTDSDTGQFIEPQTDQQVTHAPEITLEDGRLLRVEDLHVTRVEPSDETMRHAQAEGTLFAGRTTTPYGRLYAQSTLSDGTLQTDHLMGPGDSVRAPPHGATAVELGPATSMAAPAAAASWGGLAAALGLLGMAAGGRAASPPRSPPLLTRETQSAVPENTSAASAIYTAHAESAGQSITYSLSGTDAFKFDINSATGALTFKASPDADAPLDVGADNQYNVIVTATDSAGLSSSQTVTITVQDVVDQAPIFTSLAVKVVHENWQPDRVVHTARAEPDITTNAVTYQLSGADAAHFTLDTLTGQIKFIRAPDYEAPTDGDVNHVYDITVTALESGGFSQSQAISVEVTDLTNVLTLASANTVHVAENTTTAFYTALALVDNAVVHYSLAAGMDSAWFDINASTGALRFSSVPDFETPRDAGRDNVYDLNVVASAAGQTVTQSLAILVDDLLKEGPQLAESPLHGMVNLDVQSHLVVHFNAPVQLSTDAAIKIRIVHDLSDGFHADAEWVSEVSTQARDFEISVADATQIELSPDRRRLIINPIGDLDFGSRYHIEVDAGAFSHSAEPSDDPASAAIVAGQLAFSTVLPSTTVTGAASQKMTDDGDVTPGPTYVDIEGRGHDDWVDTALNLSSGAYTLVYKDYVKSGGSWVDAITGIGTGVIGFNLQVSGFGGDDRLYFDDQSVLNAISANSLDAFGGLSDASFYNTPASGDVAHFVGSLQIDPGSVGNPHAWIGFGSDHPLFELDQNFSHAVITA